MIIGRKFWNRLFIEVEEDEATPGHGLGLAIVRDVVDIYGGELTLDQSSAPGGLRVSVRLENRAVNDSS